MGGATPQGVFGVGDPCRTLERQAVWVGNSAAAGERIGPDRVGRNGVSAAKPLESDRTRTKRMGGVGGRAPTEILRIDGGGKTTGIGDERGLGAFFIEHEQAARFRAEGEVIEMASEGGRKIEAYLLQLRACLRGVSSQEVRDIVEEMRSHIVEKSTVHGELNANALDAALAGLGPPKILANEYLTSALLAKAEVSRSPWHVLNCLFRWASLSIGGFFVLVGAVIGYFVGGALLLCALLKPFHPQTAGLWKIPDGNDVELSLRLGFGPQPPQGHELLGWWIVPIGLVVGCGLVVITSRVALWFVRRYRTRKTWIGYVPDGVSL